MDEPFQHSQGVHFTRTLTAIPRQSERKTGEKREPEGEFGFRQKPESPFDYMKKKKRKDH